MFFSQIPDIWKLERPGWHCRWGRRCFRFFKVKLLLYFKPHWQQCWTCIGHLALRRILQSHLCLLQPYIGVFTFLYVNLFIHSVDIFILFHKQLLCSLMIICSVVFVFMSKIRVLSFQGFIVTGWCCEAVAFYCYGLWYNTGQMKHSQLRLYNNIQSFCSSLALLSQLLGGFRPLIQFWVPDETCC